jgi:hypothetical protein
MSQPIIEASKSGFFPKKIKSLVVAPKDIGKYKHPFIKTEIYIDLLII